MNLQNINYVNTLKDLINRADSIALISHKDPDGDCLGSLLGFGRILETNGRSVKMYLDGDIPFNFRFLPDISKILNKPTSEIHDLIIVLDCSDVARIGSMVEVFNHGKTSVCIDHHISNDGFCDIDIIESDYSSTGELVYEICKYIGFQIDKEAATNIYAAILTDTGKFIYSSTSAQTMRNAAELLDRGIDFSKIAENIYGNEYREVYLVKAKIMSEVEFYLEGRVSVAPITKAVLDEYGVSLKDVDGIVESIRDIEGVMASCVLKEISPKNTKVSLRSKGGVDVSAISTLYNGGGHERAAGFNLDVDVIESKKIVVELLRKHMAV
jgi:phosphoesterase RecJ-like protein